MNIDDVVKKVLSGIVKAKKDYEDWSDCPLQEAPEYLLTVYIAKEIGQLGGGGRKVLTLESKVQDIVDDAGGIGSGRVPEGTRLGGKSDVTLYWADGIPRAVIEVKNQLTRASAIEDDLIRIRSLLRNQSNRIKFGLIASCTSEKDMTPKTARSAVEHTLNEIECRTRKVLGDERRLSRFDSRIIVDGNEAWVGSVLLVK